jgi:uncharacterized protein with GYD domain
MTAPAVRVHLLLQADPGTAEALWDHLEQVPGVVRVSGTTGPFDAVAQIAVTDEAALQHVLVAVRRAPGLARICVCRAAAAAA